MIDRTELRDELDSRLEHYATKADLSAMETRLIKWLIGLMLASTAIAISLALFIQRLIN